MSSDAPQPHFVQVHQEDLHAARAELLAGLQQSLARVAPKFLYDALGSRLFDAITELAEYYPTRTEASILAQHGAEIARVVAPGSVLIDLGAASCAKAARLFSPLQPAAYLAIDISVDYLRASLQALQQRHLGLPMLGLGQDFSSDLALPEAAQRWLAAQGPTRRLARFSIPGRASATSRRLKRSRCCARPMRCAPPVVPGGAC